MGQIRVEGVLPHRDALRSQVVPELVNAEGAGGVPQQVPRQPA